MLYMDSCLDELSLPHPLTNLCLLTAIPQNATDDRRIRMIALGQVVLDALNSDVKPPGNGGRRHRRGGSGSCSLVRRRRRLDATAARSDGSEPVIVGSGAA